MSPSEYLALCMFLSFIALVFTGFPIAWILGGLSVLFTALAIVFELDMGFTTDVDWGYTSLSVDRIWNVMENWVVVALPKAIVPAAFLILAVLGSIFFGIATPTEAAGVGAAGALLLAWLNGALDLAIFREVLEETTRTTAFIFAVLLGATAFSLVLRGLGGDALIARALLSLPFEDSGIIICILLATFLPGFFLDWIELTLIVLPLVSPVVVKLGFDPVWFTVLFAVCLQTSFLTPPVGFAIFYLRGVAPAGVGVGTIYRGVIPFIVIQLIGLLIIFNWALLVTWLPARAYN